MNLKSTALLSLMMIALPLGNCFAGMASHNRWTIPEINVCFAEKGTEYHKAEFNGAKRDWKQKEKELVQRVLEEEFTAATTGYTFVGFQDCRMSEKINVVIGVRAGLSLQSIAGVKGTATVGMIHKDITSYSDAQGAVLLSPMGISKTTIIHEFGHILGLMHEHDHPSSPTMQESACPYYQGSVETRRNIIYTDFDINSVMNYCYIFVKGRGTGLSENDQQLILDIFNNRYVFDARTRSILKF